MMQNFAERMKSAVSTDPLLAKLRQVTQPEEAIHLLKTIADLDDDAKYRTEEVRAIVASLRRDFIEPNKADDALVNAFGTFFLWFVPQHQAHPIAFQKGHGICVSSDNFEIPDLFIEVLMPSAQSAASLYSVCRSACRLAFQNPKGQARFSTPLAVKTVVDAITRASDAQSMVWGATVVCNVTASYLPGKTAYGTADTFEALLGVMAKAQTADAVHWCAATFNNISTENVVAKTILTSDKKYILGFLRAFDKVGDDDSVQWLSALMSTVVRGASWDVRCHCYTRDAARSYLAAEKYCANGTSLLWLNAFISAMWPLPLQATTDTVNDTFRVLGDSELEVGDKADSFRDALRKITTAKDLVTFMSGNSPRLASRNKLKQFNDIEILIGKIECFIHEVEHDDDNNMKKDNNPLFFGAKFSSHQKNKFRYEEDRQKFICDMAQKLFTVHDALHPLPAIFERLSDFFFLTLLANAVQAKDNFASADSVLRLINHWIIRTSPIVVAKSITPAVIAVIMSSIDAATRGNRNSPLRFSAMSLSLRCLSGLCTPHSIATAAVAGSDDYLSILARAKVVDREAETILSKLFVQTTGEVAEKVKAILNRRETEQTSEDDDDDDSGDYDDDDDDDNWEDM